MKTIKKLAIVVIVLPLLAVISCDSKTSGSKAANRITPKTGAICTVQFRRDALGAGASLPIPPTTDNINGAQVSIGGRFSRMDDSWIVLTAFQNDKEEIWIPHSVILLIKVGG